MPSAKQETMSVPPEIEASCTSGPMADATKSYCSGPSGDPVESSVRRTARPCRSRGPVSRLFERREVARAGAEDRDAFVRGHLPEHFRPGMERRAVVQDDRRLRSERAGEPVPHHPAAGREEEQPVARLHVGVQPMFLQVLQQRAAGAVDDALRHAGRAARIEHVQRMVEWQCARTGPRHPPRRSRRKARHPAGSALRPAPGRKARARPARRTRVRAARPRSARANRPSCRRRSSRRR